MISAGSSPQTGDGAWVRVGIVSAAVVDAGTAVVTAADTEGKVGAGVAAVGGRYGRCPSGIECHVAGDWCGEVPACGECSVFVPTAEDVTAFDRIGRLSDAVSVGEAGRRWCRKGHGRRCPCCRRSCRSGLVSVLQWVPGLLVLL